MSDCRWVDSEYLKSFIINTLGRIVLLNTLLNHLIFVDN